jgi:hypothetical protein
VHFVPQQLQKLARHLAKQIEIRADPSRPWETLN